MDNNNNTTANMTLPISSLKNHYTLLLICFGITLNLLTLIVLCRPTSTSSHLRPTLHYMYAMVIFPILL